MDYQVFLIRISGGTTFGSRHSKGGKILRVFESCISISNLSPAQEVASVEYMFENISNVLPSAKDEYELTFNVLGGSGKGYETLHIFCDSRSELITTLLNKIDDLNGIGTDFALKKHSHESGGLVETVLRIRSASIVKMVNSGVRQERRMVNPAKKINFNAIVKIETVNDDERIVLLYLNSRIMRLSLTDSTPFLLALSRNMKFYLNRDLQVEKINTATMVDIFSIYLKRVKALPILFEFQVLKKLEAKSQERKRTVSICKEHFIEIAGEEVISMHSLSDILGLIVSDKNPNEVVVEFRSWRPMQYFIQDRDEFIASVADVVGTARSSQFDIRPVPFFRHKLPESHRRLYQFDYETYYLTRLMSEFNGNRDPAVLHITLKEFASNVHIGKSRCSDPRAVCAVAELLREWNSCQDFVRSTTCCIVLHRLFTSRQCFESLKSMTNVIWILLQCMRSENALLVYTASVALRSALNFSGDIISTDRPNTLKQEHVNKFIVLSLENMQQLTSFLRTYYLAKNNVLQVYGMVKLLTAGLENLSLDTDASRAWMKAFESSIMAVGDVLCAVSRAKFAIVRESTAVLLEAILTKTSVLVSNHFQSLCLERCLVLVHLQNALFSKAELNQSRSGKLVFHMLEGNEDSKRLLQTVLPKGVFYFYESMTTSMIKAGKDKSASQFSAWIKTLEALREESIETPLLVWNDMKRIELQKFLQEEVQSFDAAAGTNHVMSYNSADVKLSYSSESEGQGTVIGGVHLELLLDHHPPPDSFYASFWKLQDPLAVFQSVFQALALGFTPLFGHNNIPEIDLRLAVHALTWMYERYAVDVRFSLETIDVIEVAVGMLREVIETEHQVFVFKLVVFLLTMVEAGGRDNVLRFVHAGGITVLTSSVVLSLAECCNDKLAFEADGWNSANSSLETVKIIGLDGETRLARVPSGKTREVFDKAVLNQSLDAKEAVKWHDESVPSKIQLGMALDLLESLLRVSGSESNLESFPPSAVCLALSREEVLCHLVQSLLRAKTPVFGRILNIVSHLVKVNNCAMSRMYKLGAFEILLWKLLVGDIMDSDKKMIIKFFCQSHLLQVPNACARDKNDTEGRESSIWHSSILRFYLPEGLILKLMSEGPDVFLELLDSEENGPEIVWNMDMRERLSSHLTSELESYVKFRATDPMALYIHVPRTLVYPELADAVFSAPFYLHNLLDTERFPTYPLNNPAGFLNNVIEDLKTLASDFTQATSNGMTGSFWRKEISKIHLLLSSLAYLLERLPDLLIPHDIEAIAITLATPALRNALVQRDDPSPVVSDILLQTTRVLRRISATTIRETEVPNPSVNFALSVLSLGTRLKADGTFPESSVNGRLESTVAGAFLMLELTSGSRAGRELLQDDVRWRKGLWWALCSAASDAASIPPSGPSPVSFAALNCLKHFVVDEKCSDRIIKQGLYLPMLLLTIPPADVTLNTQSSKSALLYSVADVLRCLIYKDASRQNLMAKVIPVPLLACLDEVEGPDKFITMTASDIVQPMALWTARVREELRNRIYERLCYHGVGLTENSAVQEDELEWLQEFSYKCLHHEIVIGGFYVKGLLNCNLGSVSFALESSLIDSLVSFLEQHYSVALSPSEAAGNSDGMLGSREGKRFSLEDYLSVLAALKECIIYAFKSNKEEIVLQFRLRALSRLILQWKMDANVQSGIASITKVIVQQQAMVTMVLQSQMLEALTVQLWEASAEFSGKGMENVLQSTLEALYVLSEQMPATIAATNNFAVHGTLLPLLALFCNVGLPVLRGTACPGPKMMPTGFASRLVSAKILGQLLLAGNGVSRRAKLIKDLEEERKPNADDTVDDGIGEATDMYELLSVLERSAGNKDEEPLVIKSLLLLLPLDILSAQARNPSEACKMYDSCCQTPRLVWDDDTRHQVKTTLEKETIRVQTLMHRKASCGLPAWSLVSTRPVFLRWALVAISEPEKRPFYRQDSSDDYAQELYLGGFYVDQFLQNFQYPFAVVLQERFLHELRKALVIGTSTDGLYAEAFNFDDRRRLLLALLFLFKVHPRLFSGRSNIDIFLPLYALISNEVGTQRRALAQPAILLLHCIATHPDIVDCMSSEELIYTLASFLTLNVPSCYVGDAGTDPRLCSLMLLLRLMRLSSSTIDIVLKLGIMSKLEDLILDFDGSTVVKQRAAECLAVMCADKRKGNEVQMLLEKLIPANVKGYGAWRIPLSKIQDEIIEMRTLQHFLRSRHPSPWWTADTPEGIDSAERESAGPATILEASLTFPKAKMSDFNNEVEIVFRRSVAAMACVNLRDVRIVRKRIGSVIIDFEVTFQKTEHDHVKTYQALETEVYANAFKEKLERSSTSIFADTFFESLGAARVTSISMKRIDPHRQNSWKNGSIPTLGDKGVIYVAKESYETDKKTIYLNSSPSVSELEAGDEAAKKRGTDNMDQEKLPSVHSSPVTSPIVQTLSKPPTPPKPNAAHVKSTPSHVTSVSPSPLPLPPVSPPSPPSLPSPVLQPSPVSYSQPVSVPPSSSPPQPPRVSSAPPLRPVSLPPPPPPPPPPPLPHFSRNLLPPPSPPTLLTNGTNVHNGDRNGTLLNGVTNGNVHNGDTNGALLNGVTNGNVHNGDTNGTLLKGVTNGNVQNGDTNGALLNGVTNGNVHNGDTNGTLLKGVTNGNVQNGDTNSASLNGDLLQTGATTDGNVHNGDTNDTLLNGVTNGNVQNGYTNDSLLNGVTNGNVQNGDTNSASLNGVTNGMVRNGDTNGTFLNGPTDGLASISDGPVDHAPESSSRAVFRSNITLKSEEGRLVPLEKGLDLVLEGADITETNRQVAKSNFLEAFEDEQEELGRMVEKYPKLLQKYPLQPQLCYDLMAAWGENCLDLLSSDELRKHGRSIATFDICRLDDPGTAAEEAKRKFQAILKIRKEQEWKERSKKLKGDMSAELAKAVGGRKEKLTVEAGKDELKALSKGKIQTKKKQMPFH